MKKPPDHTVTRRELLKVGAIGLIADGIPNAVLGVSFSGPDALTEDFIKPPDSARPWVYWFFMDGNLTREGITADLEAMKKAGIGGAVYMEVGLGIPPGPVEFMSDLWQDLLGHAFLQADRLGLQIALASGPGWCGTGGPWVKPEESMQHLVASEASLKGPVKFNAQLPKPTPRTPFFGEATLPPELHKVWKEFYQDVLVLAFPTPTGDARIPDVDEKALYTRGSYSSQIPGPYSSRPWVRPFLPMTGVYAQLSSEECIVSGEVLDITDRLTPDGRLLWDVPSGNWTIMRMGRTITGQTTRPAPKPGLGLETDKFSRTAINAHFDAYITPLLSKSQQPKHAQRGLTTLHFDSWEMSSQNWSANFREEFHQRRGYDLARFLPTFSGYVVDNPEVSERFLWDFRRTAQELVIENQAMRLHELGERHGLQLALEPYDLNPCSDLELGSAADIPMGEFWSAESGIPTEFSLVEATSVGHTLGRPIIASEAFTAGTQELWHQYPGSMKNQGDWALCAGINRFVFHRFQAQPWSDRIPGMTMGLKGGFGVHWDRTQTWWDMVPAYHLYLSRCQQMLRRGLFVADILYLTSEGAPNVFLPPPSAFHFGQLPDRQGYNFDGCSADALITRAAVKDGCIVFPDGMTYRLLVLPQVQMMTPALLQKINKLVEDGASVIGTPPSKSPSLVNYPQCDQEVQKIANILWGNEDTLSRKVGKGQVFCEPEAMRARDANPLNKSYWIWSPEDTATPAMHMATKRYFSRRFEIEDARTINSAQVAITASASFEFFVNDQSVETGQDYRKVQRVDVTSLLRSGNNMLTAVAAANDKSSSLYPGLIGALTIHFDDGKSQIIDTDRQWNSSLTDRGAQRHAIELGAFDASPWKLNQPSLQEDTIYPSYRVTSRVMSRMGVLPDFDGGDGIRYIHRRDGDEDIYFITSRERRTQTTTCQFRISGRQPEWWNPMTGERRNLPQFVEKEGRTSISIHLSPFESGFVIFRRPTDRLARGSQNFPELRTITTLTDQWNVAFDPKWGGPAEIVFPALEDWSKRSELTIRHYSGKAVYRTTFDCTLTASKTSYCISLGIVKNLASVKLNDRDLGVVWCDPWQVAIPDGVLQERNNQLEVVVANLWINRLIGDSGLPQEKRFTWVPDNPFCPESTLQESGLLGPVTIRQYSQ